MKNDLSDLAEAIHSLIEVYDAATYALRVVCAGWEEREEPETTKDDEDD